MCTSLKSDADILKVIQAFHTVRIILFNGCSDTVVDDLKKHFKILQPQILNFFLIEEQSLLFCIMAKVSMTSRP